jgi:hypothetical protein
VRLLLGRVGGCERFDRKSIQLLKIDEMRMRCPSDMNYITTQSSLELLNSLSQLDLYLTPRSMFEIDSDIRQIVVP